MIKNVLKVKLDKTLRTNLFNNTILPTMLYTCEMWVTTKKKEKRPILLREHFQSDIICERNEGRDRGILEAEVPLG